MSILDQLRLGGSLSRAQIATRLGLTRATVSKIVSELIEMGWLRESVFEEGGLGRRGMLLELDSACGAMVAVELDIDRVAVVLADAGMSILWRGQAPLGERIKPEEGVRLAADLVGQALEEAARIALPCLGIGVAWAGLVDRDEGELVYGPISGWEKVRLRSEWAKRFEVPIFVENEAHAGAIAAHHFGQPRRVANLIYLSLGMGMSAGVYVDGKLVRGKDGFAGQVGHTSFVSEGHPCGCGRRGCWVTEIGAEGFLRKLRERGVPIEAKDGAGLAWIEDVCALAANGDAATLAALEELGRQLGEGLARLVQVFNPSRIVVGGHLRRIVKLCQDTVAGSLREAAFGPMIESLEFQVNENDEEQIMGCLATVFDAALRDPLPLAELKPARSAPGFD